MNRKGAEVVLAAIDASIEKWHSIAISKDYVYNDKSVCPLCGLFDAGSSCIVDEEDFICADFLPNPDICPIMAKTGQDDCKGSSFYGTSLWSFVRQSMKCLKPQNYLTRATRKADNQMLILLYEVRREQLLYLLRET